jgi:hypothetical protein
VKPSARLKTGVHIPAQNHALPTNALKDRLSKSSEINITVTGRKSGRPVSIPIWFVFDDDQLHLLPVKGSDTHWYKNVLKNSSIGIDARGRS